MVVKHDREVDLGVAINRETGKRIEAERAAAKAESDNKALEKSRQIQDDILKASRLAGQGGKINTEALRAYDELKRRKIDISKIDPDLPEMEAEEAVGVGLDLAKKERAAEETKSQVAFARRLKYLSGRTGKVELESGKIVDIDDLKTKATQKGAETDKELRNEVDRVFYHFRGEADKAAKAKREEEATQAAVDAAIRKEIRNNPEKAFQWKAYQDHIQSLQGQQGGFGAAASNAPASTATTTGGTSQPATSSSSTTSTQKPPQPNWYYTPGGVPAQQGTPSSTPAQQQTGKPFAMADTEPKIERTWIDRIQIAQANNIKQPELTTSVADYAMKKARQPRSSSSISMASSGSEETQPDKDSRYGAKKATGVQTGSGYRSQISALAESPVNFKQHELKNLLEGRFTGISNLGQMAGEKLKSAGKNLAKDIVGMSWKPAIDRYPFALNQAGWSKAKSARGAKHILDNPHIATGILTAAGAMGASPASISMLLRAAGRGTIGRMLVSSRPGLKKAGSVLNATLNAALNSLDDPETRANAAIGLEAIKGDPRAVLVDPAALVKSLKKDEDDNN